MEPDRLGRRVWALFTQYRASLVAIVVAVLAEDPGTAPRAPQTSSR